MFNRSKRRQLRYTASVLLSFSAAAAIFACSPPVVAAAAGSSRTHQSVAKSTVATPSIGDIDTTEIDAITQSGPFAGASYDASTGTVTVHASSPLTSDENAKLQSITLPPGWHLTTDQVPLSWSTLSALMDKLTAGTFDTEVTGQLSEWAIDPDSNTVQVGLVDPSLVIENALRTALGTTALSFIQRDRATPTTKYRDDEQSAPFHAGGRIQTTVPGYVVSCSAGFYMKVGGAEEMLTAGHCGMGHGNSEIDTSTGGYKIGNVVHRSVTDGGFDSEYYSGSFSTYAWIGGTHSSTGNAVTGSYSPAQGASICQDGAFTGEKCGIVMNSPSDACVVFDYRPAPYNGNLTKICDLRYAYAPSGIAISEGDSGGPVIVDDGSTIRAVGTNVGEDGSGANSSGMYYHPIARVLSYWGGTLVTN